MIVLVNHLTKEYYISDIKPSYNIEGYGYSWLIANIRDHKNNHEYKRVKCENAYHLPVIRYTGTPTAAFINDLYSGMILIEKFNWKINDIDIVLSSCNSVKKYKYKDYKRLTVNYEESLTKWLSTKEETSSENEININDYES